MYANINIHSICKNGSPLAADRATNTTYNMVTATSKTDYILTSSLLPASNPSLGKVSLDLLLRLPGFPALVFDISMGSFKPVISLCWLLSINFHENNHSFSYLKSSVSHKPREQRASRTACTAVWVRRGWERLWSNGEKVNGTTLPREQSTRTSMWSTWIAVGWDISGFQQFWNLPRSFRASGPLQCCPLFPECLSLSLSTISSLHPCQSLSQFLHRIHQSVLSLLFPTRNGSSRRAMVSHFLLNPSAYNISGTE